MREMKDSGIDRIGLIPNYWSIPRLKHIISEIGSGTTPSSGKEIYYENGEYYWIQSGDLYKTKYIIDTEKKLTELAASSFSALKEYKADFLVIAMYGASIGNVSISKISARTNQACCAIKPNDSVDFLYLYYVLCADKDIMLDMSIGGTQPNISQAKIMELPIMMPPKEEQIKIATYLETKCAEIDSLISDIQSQIEALEEYKRSVITEAVTKGLDPDVEMRDSGIAWVGDIPAHWLVEKVKFHLQRYEPRNPGDKQVLSVYREYGVIPKDSRDDNHNVTSEDTSNYKYVVPGNLVINKMKAWQGSMGVSEYEGIVSPAYFIYKFTDNQIIPKYLHYLFRSCYKDEFRRISGGIREGQWDLSPYEFSNTLLLIPSTDEQNRIVSYIDARISEIEAAIAEKKQQIETIEEYKKSLIFEYVTGKKEV